MADDSRKLFYSIGEVADIFHVNESTLRFWEKEFPTVIKPKKNLKGTRNYTKDDIESIRLIHFLLKEKGMTLAGARKKLREEKKGMTSQHELADRLKKIKSELLKLQTELGKPVQEAPEFPNEELISKRMVFAAPGSEMISVESILEENLVSELAMEEIPVPDIEHLSVAEPIFEESPFDFQPEVSDSAPFVYELEESEPEVELVEEPELEPVSESEPEVVANKEDELSLDESLISDIEDVPQIVTTLEPETEEPAENVRFYEQPENTEEPEEPVEEGWAGTLF